MAVKFNKIEQVKATSQPSRAKSLSNYPFVWPLDSKIPDYRSLSGPDEALYFTCGKLGQSLYTTKKEFDLKDPKGLRNPYKDYTALHDPQAQRYFQKQNVIEHLKRHNLINEENQVLCNAKDYNQFRAYLATLQNEKVLETLKTHDDIREIELQIQSESRKLEKENELAFTHSERLEQARTNVDVQTLNRMIDIRKNIEKWKQQVAAVDRRRKEEVLQTVEKHSIQEEKEEYLRNKLEVRKRVKARAIFIDLLCREMQDTKKTSALTASGIAKRRELKQQEEINKFLIQQESDEQSLMLMDKMTDKRQKTRTEWIQKYEKQMSYQEKNHEKIKAIKKARADRIFFLQRKYYDMWREKVIARRDLKPGSAHKSSWNIDLILKHNAEYLEAESGYDPKNNFFAKLLHGGAKIIKKQESELQTKNKDGSKKKTFTKT